MNSSKLLPISQTLFYHSRKQPQSVRPSLASSLVAVLQNHLSHLRRLPQQVPHSFPLYLLHLDQNLLQPRVSPNLLLLVHSLSFAACYRAPNYPAQPTNAPFCFLFRLRGCPHQIPGLHSHPQLLTCHSAPPSHFGIGLRLPKTVHGLRDLPGLWPGLKAGWVQQMQNYAVISIRFQGNACLTGCDSFSVSRPRRRCTRCGCRWRNWIDDLETRSAVSEIAVHYTGPRAGVQAWRGRATFILI